MTFLFPRLDCGIIISNFEKIAFFGSMAIFGLFSPPPKAFFAARTFLKSPYFLKKMKKWKVLWGFFRKTSKLSRNLFWTSWDHLGAQKSHFKKKKSKNVANTSKPPLVSELRDMARILKFFFLFSQRNIFWKISPKFDLLLHDSQIVSM